MLLPGSKTVSLFVSSSSENFQLQGGPIASFRRRHKKPAQAKTLKAVLDTGVNLRDVGATAGGALKPGTLYRSSELLGCV